MQIQKVENFSTLIQNTFFDQERVECDDFLTPSRIFFQARAQVETPL